MKKMAKIIISMILVMIFTAGQLVIAVPEDSAGFGLRAFAAGGSCGYGLSWSLDDNGKLTISGSGSMNEWEPDAQPWKNYRDNIKSVYINKGVDHISAFAFQDCSNMTTAVIADSVLTIGAFAFMDCTSLLEINIPANTTVGDLAFNNCTSLRKINLAPGSVNYRIVDGVLYDKNLKTLILCPAANPAASIVIPKSVIYIGDLSFAYCKNIVNVEIPSEAMIDKFAFFGCDSLRSINVAADHDYYRSIDGVLYSKDAERLICCPGGKTSINIPDSVICIEDCAFGNCRLLKAIKLPDNLQSILGTAFAGCESLTQIVIPEGVSDLESMVFKDCTSLESVVILNPECSIDNKADVMPQTTIIRGFAGSTAEKYAKRFSRTFIAVDKPVMNDLQIKAGSDKYAVFVSNGTEYISGATVKLGDRTAVTNEDGYVLFEDVSEKSATLSVAASGYAAFETDNYYIKIARQDIIDIGAESFSEVAMLYGGVYTNLLTTPAGISLDYPAAAVKITFNDNISGAAAYVLASYDGTEIASATVDSKKFSCKVKDFSNFVGNLFLIEARDSTGKVLAREHIALSVLAAYEDEEIELEIGGGDGVSVGNLCGGLFSDVKFELDSFGVPISVKVTGDTIRIGANLITKDGNDFFNDDYTVVDPGEWQETEEKWQKFTDGVDDICKNVDKAKGLTMGKAWGDLLGSTETDWGVALYAEGVFREGEPAKLTGRLVLSAEIEMGSEYQIYPSPPLVAGFDIAGMIGADGELQITSLIPLDVNAAIILKGEIEVGGHVGLGIADIASVGLYGDAAFNVEYTMKWAKDYRYHGFNKITLGGELGVYASFLVFEEKFTILKGTWDIVSVDTNGPRASGSPAYALMMNTGAAAKSTANTQTADASDFQPADREYLAERSEWLGSTAGGSALAADTGSLNKINMLQTSVYKGMSPQVVSAGGVTMLVYEQDIAERADGNRTAVVYSIYNKADSTWSNPVIISDDGTADFYPAVYASENGIWAAWQNLDADAVSGISQMNALQAAQNMELCAAFYDVSTGKWSDAKIVTDNSVYEQNHALTVSGGTAYLVWSENQDGDVFGQNNTNVIKYSTFDGSEWSAPAEVVSGLNTVADLAVGRLDGGLYIAAVIDEDCTLKTSDDHELVLYTLSGVRTPVTDNSLSENVPVFTSYGGTDYLSWNCAGNIYVISEAGGDATAFIDEPYAYAGADAKLVASGSNAAIIFTNNANGSSQLYMMAYDAVSDEWGAPVAQTSQSNYIKNADGAFVDGELITVFNVNEYKAVSNGFNLTANLGWMKCVRKMNTAVVDVRMDYSEVAPGADVYADVYIENRGNLAADNFVVKLKNAGGQVICTGETELHIPAGQAGVAKVKLTMPQTISADKYIFTVEEKNTADSLTADNSLKTEISYADLAVEMQKVIIDNTEVVMITVTNHGIMTTGGTLKLYREDGTECGSYTVPNIARNEMAQFTAAIDNDGYFKAGETSNILTASVVSNKTDWRESNNSDMLVIEKRAVLVSGVALEKEASVYAGGKITLQAVVSPANADNLNVKWSSSDSSVAAVKNGVVTGLKPGTAVITAITEDGGFEAQCKVTVENFSITVSANTLNLKTGATYKLSANVTPSGTAVIWESSNTSVATVAEDGTVTAVGAGTAIITARSNVSAAEAQCTVTVTAPEGKKFITARLAGGSRTETAVNISRETFGQADNIVLASGDNYADALAGGSLAYALEAPILLVRNNKLDDATLNDIKRLGAENVYILGGELAISNDVKGELEAIGCSVERIAGTSRFDTAVEIARKLRSIAGDPEEVFFAYSHNYPDALAISGIAAMKGCPVLYISADGTLSVETERFIQESGAGSAVILGGYLAISEAAEDNIKNAGLSSTNRIFGTSRYDTCIEINKEYEGIFEGNTVCVATGTNYPDALAGGVFAALNRAPMLLVGAELNDAQAEYLRERNNSKLFVYIFGGSMAVSEQVETQIGSLGNA